MNDGKESYPVVLYMQNPIDGFQQGAMLDLRARIALDIIKTSALMNDPTAELNTDQAATYACVLADQMVIEFQRRGWIEAVPVSEALPAELAAQAGRTGRFHATQQIAAHAAGREASGVLAVPPSAANQPIGRA